LGRYCYWDDHNLHRMRETQFPQKLNVWTGIIGNRILEPVFLHANFDRPTYLTLFQEDLMPALANNIEDLKSNRLGMKLGRTQRKCYKR
jgi:hypothetical protein